MPIYTDESKALTENIVKNIYTLQLMTETMCRGRVCGQCPLNFPHHDGCFLVKINSGITFAPQLSNALAELQQKCKHSKERKQKCQKTHR